MARSKPLSVLIVEDNPDDSRLIEHALRRAGSKLPVNEWNRKRPISAFGGKT